MSVGWDWSDLLCKWAGLEEISGGVGGVGQTFFVSGQELSHFVCKQTGLDKLCEQVGLAKFSAGAGRIDQTFFKGRRCTKVLMIPIKFLEQCVVTVCTINPPLEQHKLIFTRHIKGSNDVIVEQRRDECFVHILDRH